MLTFSVLGPLEVRRDGVRVPLGPRRHAELLALLLTRPREVVGAEALADQLWGGAPPATAANTLQGYVSGLRRALEPDRGPREPAVVLVTHPVGYRLDIDDDAVDVGGFRSLVAQARRLADTAPDDAVAAARRALALWRGPALVDVADSEWAQPVIQALDDERLAAQDLLADLRLAAGDDADLVADLRRHLTAHPLRERTAAQLMLALYRSGRQAEALDVARSTRKILDDELGIDPGAGLRELELAILRQDDDTLLIRRVPARSSTSTRGALPGRGSELHLLASAAADALAGRPRIALVTGEAGIGKTRLVQEATGALQEFRVLTGRCTDLEGTPPYWPWRQVVAHLKASDPLPVADAGDAGVPAGRFEQALQLAGRLARAALEQPLALVLEDLQWADAPSLQLLELVLAELVDARILVVLTSRAVGPSSSYALTRLVASLARQPSTLRIDLEGIDDDAVAVCVEEMTGRVPAPEVLTEVRRRSGGNPYFVRELSRLLDGDRLRPGVPDAVRDVIRMRTAALGEPVRELLSGGAVLGRDFSVATVRDMLEADVTSFVPVVEQALATGLVVEPVPGRLRFEHALVHEAVREDLSGARAMALHAAAAEALSRREKPPHGVLASHLLHAHDPRGFAEVALAAQQDLAQLAVEPALELVDHALSLTDLVLGSPSDLRELRLLRGLALIRSGRLDEGHAELVHVAEDARDAHDPELLARAALGLAGDGSVSGYWTAMGPVSGAADDVLTWLRRALEHDARLSPATRVALRAATATQLAVLGRPDPHLAAAAEAEAAGLDRDSQIRSLTARWATLWTPEHAAERLAIAGRLLELAGRDVSHQLAARHLLATALLEVGDLRASDEQAALLATTLAQHRNPDFALLVVWWRSMRRLMSGDLAGAEQAAQELTAMVGEVSGVAAATATLSTQTVAGIVAWERGQLGHAAAAFDEQGFTTHPGMQAVRALAHAEKGDRDKAHLVLTEAFGTGLEHLGTDSTALSPLVLGAETLARAGSSAQAGLLLARLTPYADRVILFAPGAVCMGAGTLYTGTLAALTGDLDRARTDLEDAVERNRALGAEPFTMRSLHRLAAVLERLGGATATLHQEAQEIAARRGLVLAPFAF